MVDAPSIVVAGAGSIGCYVGGMLAVSGRKVTLVARPRISAEIKSHGLTLTNLDGSVMRASPQDLVATETPAAFADADVVLVTVKSRDTAAIASQIRDHAPKTATIVSLQNGVKNAEVLRSVLDGWDIRAAMVPYNVVPLGQGGYHRATDGDTVVEAGPGQIGALLSMPTIPMQESNDIVGVQWGKFLINLNNALNALSGLPLQTQLRNRAWRRLMAAQWTEALAVLRANGIDPRPTTPLPVAAVPFVLRLPTAMFQRIAGAMLQIDPQARTSMSYDLIEGRPTEIDVLQGEIVRLGKACGRPTPINGMVADVIRSAEIAGQGLPNISPSALWAELNGK